MSLTEIRSDKEVLVADDDPASAVAISFFVPCYNEEANVVGAIEKLVQVTKSLNVSHEILVFDDCSRDRTVDVVRQYQRTHPDVPLRLFINSTNQGVARNFIEGAFQAKGRYYRLVCGDDAEPVETLHSILKRLGEADIVIPYHTRVIGRTFRRRVISRLYTALVNVASGRHLNYYNGMPIFRRRDVLRFHVEATGSGYQAEFLLRLLQEDRSYIEVPLVAEDRSSGSLNFRNFLSVGYSIFKIALRRLRNASFR